jgi:hypothetical protein
MKVTEQVARFVKSYHLGVGCTNLLELVATR